MFKVGDKFNYLGHRASDPEKGLTVGWVSENGDWVYPLEKHARFYDTGYSTDDIELAPEPPQEASQSSALTITLQKGVESLEGEFEVDGEVYRVSVEKIAGKV